MKPFLLLYATDWRFITTEDEEKLVAFDLYRTPPAFESVFLVRPIDNEAIYVRRLFPYPPGTFDDFDPEEARSWTNWKVDPRGWTLQKRDRETQ